MEVMVSVLDAVEEEWLDKLGTKREHHKVDCNTEF